MSYLFDQLKKLDGIAQNPNLNGGVYNSFSLFISISDGLLERKETFSTKTLETGTSCETIFRELDSIRNKFNEKFGFSIEKRSTNFGPKFESSKNSPSKSRKFCRNLSEFMQSYRGKFLWIFKGCKCLLTPFSMIKNESREKTYSLEVCRR